jgi:hypothetical protein
MKQYLKLKTRGLRHGIAKLVAPAVFADHLAIKDMLRDVASVPRPMTVFLKEHFKTEKQLVCIEIGVALAENAFNMLQELPIRKMFLIDPYTTYIEDGTTSSRFKDSFTVAKERVSRFPQARFIRKTSDDAVVDLHEMLDFVYIDGNHSYENVKSDINHYFPLIKPNGVIGGHDYVPYYFKGVVQAVTEFASHYGKQHLRISYPDWWVLKQC